MTETPTAPAAVGNVRWLSDPEQKAWRSFIEGTGRFTRRLDEILRKQTGLTMDDYEILVFLSECDDGTVRMSDLADHLRTSRSRLTYRVDGLEKRGLVNRRRCPDDRRAIHAHMTEKGWAALRAAAPIHVASVRSQLLDHLSDEEFQLLGRLMQRIPDGRCEPEL